MPSPVLTPDERAKEDTRSDALFYQQPRFVQHIDEAFRARLTALYRERLDPGSRVLDLMSSWVSHLPEDVTFSEVVGHGLNGEELAANPRLDRHFTQNLNETQTLPLQSGAFDAVLCAVSVQYVQQPERVFAEIARVLRPGGSVIVSFSNRMFAQKAIRAWRQASGPERARLVARYIESTGAFEPPEVVTGAGEGTPLSPTQRFFGGAPDPFYAVVAWKESSTGQGEQAW